MKQPLLSRRGKAAYINVPPRPRFSAGALRTGSREAGRGIEYFYIADSAALELMDQGPSIEDKDCRGKYTLIRDVEDLGLGMFDKPLPCFGCGIGWFSFLIGFALPLMWYYATILYFSNYCRKDPRERAGLAASAIAALVFSMAALITTAIILF